MSNIGWATSSEGTPGSRLGYTEPSQGVLRWVRMAGPGGASRAGHHRFIQIVSTHIACTWHSENPRRQRSELWAPFCATCTRLPGPVGSSYTRMAAQSPLMSPWIRIQWA
jgi:hypothetical protein